MGFFSTPSFADLYGDGDLDAVVGTLGRHPALFREHRLGHRTGLHRTAPAPPIRSTASTWTPLAPSFADPYGDGDLDAVIGERFGDLHYFRNTGAGFT